MPAKALAMTCFGHSRQDSLSGKQLTVARFSVGMKGGLLQDFFDFLN
jgi:hypothetical protein